MRIGIYDPYLDDLGGGEKYMASIASYLRKDNEVDIFWDKPNDVDSLEERFSIDLTNVGIKKNIFSANFGFLQRLFASRSYDIIIFLSDGSIPFVLSKKLFIHLQQPLDQFNKNSLRGRIKLSRVTGIFCNSEYTKSFNDNRFHISSSVVYPPVALKPTHEPKENIILTVGRFRSKDVMAGTDDYKKFPVMIAAFTQMVDSGLSDWRFVIGTSIKDVDEEKFNKVKKLTGGYPIEFLINKSNDELWDIYSRSKIYWHAAGYGEDLRKFPQRAEHFGISTVEAMGAGAVPVVINAGGQKEIVMNGENGYVWDTLEELKKYTLTLTTDNILLHRLSKKAAIQATNFSQKKFQEHIADLLTVA